MDHLRDTSLPAPRKTRRRRHTPEFKAKIVTLSKEPGTSIALLAQQYQLNANLIHKWRRETKTGTESQNFLPLPVAAPSASAQTVRIEFGALTIHWPLSHIDNALPWLKALQP